MRLSLQGFFYISFEFVATAADFPRCYSCSVSTVNSFGDDMGYQPFLCDPHERIHSLDFEGFIRILRENIPHNFEYPCRPCFRREAGTPHAGPSERKRAAGSIHRRPAYSTRRHLVPACSSRGCSLWQMPRVKLWLLCADAAAPVDRMLSHRPATGRYPQTFAVPPDSAQRRSRSLSRGECYHFLNHSL